MNIDDERDELWHLLGKARESQVSPFFARNVLRAIREEKPSPRGVVGWLLLRWKVAALAVGGVAVVALTMSPKTEQPDPIILAAREVSASPDYQVIKNLDDLLDSERNSVWLEASAY